MKKTRLKSISDKRRAQLEEQGLPLFTFGRTGQNKASVRRKSSSAAAREAKYRIACDTVDMADIRKYGAIICRFCKQPIGDDLHHHHVAGRTGALMYNPQNIWPAHAECHSVGSTAYHNTPLGYHIRQPWFKDMLNTLRLVDEACYRLRLGKAVEAGYVHYGEDEPCR